MSVDCQNVQNLVNGALFAQVLNSYGGYSEPNQTQITTIDDSPILDPSSFSITPINSNQIQISGSGFSSNFWENSIELFNGKGKSIPNNNNNSTTTLFSINPSLSNETSLILDFIGSFEEIGFGLENHR